MRDQLIEAVQTARQAGTPAPSNEQETCYRIIDPLLKAMGYGVLDVRIQDKDNAGQKPDYTILPDGGDATWFMEAKAWSVSLQDHHTQQAVNYANTQGKRWVVLTNGREWRLYDNQAFGEISVKLACVARLEDEDILGLLEALSRSSIERGRLEDFARNTRLYNCLFSQL
ncbi:MAG TPA: type I restriction enzyme HsdR N-terminal domain-containing protein [Fimbriimonadaceae bacterium]|nr:type I restriction enzyme HsdR N-terminal domain-containing protein [Fimbriimonadaceae bacterium]HRJ95805.1 type I restriction enzyme HsdR N-terminal domain-containing protein [Fimbriimonadaceae bacterium]